MPPNVKEFKNFEDDMIKLVQSVKFKDVSNHTSVFQRNLSQDLSIVKNNPNIIVKGDKTSCNVATN